VDHRRSATIGRFDRVRVFVRSCVWSLGLVFVFVLWKYDGPQYHDVIEVSTNLVSWAEVPRPYTITNGEWMVEFVGPKAAYFRVRRSWAK
jgi:hypothetical protein